MDPDQQKLIAELKYALTGLDLFDAGKPNAIPISSPPPRRGKGPIQLSEGTTG